MIRLFQSSLPSRIILLATVWLIFVVVSIIFPKPIELNHFRILLEATKVNEGSILYNSIYDYSGILVVYINAFFLKFVSFDSILIKIISSILILINAIYLNGIVEKYRLNNERTFVPGLITLVLSFSFYQNLQLDSILLGNLFLTLAISSLLKTGLEQADVIGKSFNAGTYIGLAFLCDQMFIVYLILGFIALQYFSSKGIKGYINLLLGFTFPILIIFLVYLFFGNHDDFILYFFSKYFFTTKAEHVFGLSNFYPWLVFSVLGIILFFIKKSILSFKNYVSKSHQIFVFWLILSFVVIIFFKDRLWSDIFLIANPLGFVLSFYLINTQKSWVKESIFLLLLLFSMLFNFFVSSNPLFSNEVLNKSLIDNSIEKYDGKILCLYDNPLIYVENKHGSAFTNWELEKKTFLNLEEKGNLEKIYLGITSDYPKYIIDPNGVFDRIIERIPLFKKKYKRLDSKTYRLK